MTAEPTSSSALKAAEPDSQALAAEDFDVLDDILDDLRTRHDETPQWEFCEGFMAALICCRRPIPPAEFLPVLLDVNATDESAEGSFADDAQYQLFMALWQRRRNEITLALAIEIENLAQEGAFHPEVMDLAGAIASLPAEERESKLLDTPPSYAQVWALGFMSAVENWVEEWSDPRDKEAVKILHASLDAIMTLCDKDTDPPSIPIYDDTGPPSVSEKRMGHFALAVWAVYDLRALWQSLGPKIETVRKEASPGRNDPCPCGSGKKYKKCHGAT